MLSNKKDHSSLYDIQKRRKWLYDIVIHQRIGKELFLKQLLKKADRGTLEMLEEYPDLTTSLSIHLICQSERHGEVDASERLSLIRYQSMTEETFNELKLLFQQVASDVNQRQMNYRTILECAISTSEEQVQTVLQWIEKRFTNEQIIVIEYFLSRLSGYNSRFQLEILPLNFKAIEGIINIALNHMQKSAKTEQIIVDYGFILLQRVERHPNKEQREKIQAFASKIIKR
jgi:hypothetical protein